MLVQGAKLLTTTEARRSQVSLALATDERADLGQFFTPAAVARFLASLFEIRQGPATVLDPGAGIGSLTAAFVARWAAESRYPLAVTANEVVPNLTGDLKETLDGCARLADLSINIQEGGLSSGPSTSSNMMRLLGMTMSS